MWYYIVDGVFIFIQFKVKMIAVYFLLDKESFINYIKPD